MPFFKLATFQARLATSFAFISIVSILAVVMGIFLIGKVRDQGSHIFFTNAPSIRSLEQLNNSLQKTEILLLKHFHLNEAMNINRLEEVWKKEIDPAMEELENGSDLWSDESAVAIFDALSSSLKKIRRLQSSLLKETQRHVNMYAYPGVFGDTIIINEDFETWLNNEASQLPLKYKGELATLTRSVSTDIGNLEKSLQAENIDAFGQMYKRLTALKWVEVGLVLIMAIFAFGIWRFLSRHFERSIGKVESQLWDLSQGNILKEVGKTEDELNPSLEAIELLNKNLRKIKLFFQEVSRGNISNDIEIFEKEGDLGSSLDETKRQLSKIEQEDRRRNWSNKGFALFADILGKHSEDLDALTDELIASLVKYLNANQGGIFLQHKTAEEKFVMRMEGAYAYDRKKYLQKSIEPGQGLVGQCWQEKKSIYMTKVPEGYVAVTSGLGKSTPSSILVMPLKIKKEVFGIIELASFNDFNEYEREFVETLSETIATSISNAKTNEKTRHLLEESQQMTEEMQAQEEEMRQNLEELQATQEDVQRRNEEYSLVQKEIKEQQANLNALINNTADSIILIDNNYKVLVLNDVVKQRYKGTQYEGIDVGTDALTLLGDVRDEWKGYYDQALKGERLNFVLKSSVQGEDSYREYFINPIIDGQEIVGVSVFSRDITREKQAQLEAKEKTAYLDLIESMSKGFIPLKSIDEVMQLTVNVMCDQMDWTIGHVYMLKQQVLVSAKIWNSKVADGHKGFMELSEQTTFGFNEGLPGRVWAQKEPAWIEDVTQDDNFPRANATTNLGVKGAFSLPIIFEGEVFGVMEFFNIEKQRPNVNLLKMAANVGQLVGRAVEHFGLVEKLRSFEKQSKGATPRPEAKALKSKLRDINKRLKKI